MQRFRVGDKPPKAQSTKDPNVLTLTGSNKIRLVDTTGAGTGIYEQHVIPSLDDDNQVYFVVCPGRAVCPLCRKPVARGEDGEEVQLFPRSVRYITNVWDYGSGSIKVLIGGPQIFKQFEQAQEAGIDPTGCDWTINKQGKGKSTKYIVVRDDASAFAFADKVQPDSLHDLDKYGNITSPEKIFEILEKAAWDYDAIEAPSFTSQQALEFVLPFGECKGMTVEQALAQNQSWCEWLHETRLADEQIFDPIFLALDKAMKDRGIEVGEFEEAATTSQAAPAEPAATETAAVADPTPEPEVAAGPSMATLIDPSGNEIEVPENTVDNLLQAGFSRKPEPEPEPTPEPEPEDPNAPVTLSKEGAPDVTVPASAAAPLEAAGYSRQAPEPDLAEQPCEVLPEPVLATTAVQVLINGTTLPLPFKTALDMQRAGTEVAYQEGHVGDYANLLLSTGGEPPQPGEVQTQAEHDLHQEGQNPTGEPDPDKPFSCEICGKAYKTKGAVTQHVNREHGANEPAATPAAATPSPAAAAAPTNGGDTPAADRDEAMNQVKAVLAKYPESQYKLVMKVFGDSVGKRNISDFTQKELEATLPALHSELANI